MGRLNSIHASISTHNENLSLLMKIYRLRMLHNCHMQDTGCQGSPIARMGESVKMYLINLFGRSFFTSLLQNPLAFLVYTVYYREVKRAQCLFCSRSAGR